jgi:translation initiation factor IF-2
VASEKIRIYELSKALGVANKDLMTILEKEFGMELKSHSSSIDKDLADKIADMVKNKDKAPAASKTAPAKKAPEASKPSAAKPPEAQKLPQAKQAPEVMETTKSEPAKPVSKPVQAAPEKQVAKPLAQAVEKRPEQPVQKVGQAPEQKTGPKPQGPATDSRSSGGILPPNQGAGATAVAVKPAPPTVVSQPQTAQSQPQQHQPQVASKPLPGVKTIAASTKTQMPHQGRPHHKPGHPSHQHQQRRHHGDSKAPQAVQGQAPVEVEAEPEIKTVKINDPLTVTELAQKLNLKETEIIKHLFMKGTMVTVNQTLDVNYARTIAKEFEFEIEETVHPGLQKGEYNPAVLENKATTDITKYKNLQPRSPVISIMGHVDHGKTSLLDAIRETRNRIVDTEAGGITQSIGAYTTERNGHRIVFLDTPGHEAFTSMRMRGAKATDIAILVVAADDGVMPQTIEAINHAKAANIPIIVAVNKIDKEGADPDKVLVQLSEHGLVAEKWGGDTITEEVSAIQKLGLDELLDSILLVSELLELKADATVAAEGVIIEAQLDKRKGATATALVQQGTLKVGDNVLIGSVGGRVRALFSDLGERVIKAGPSTPVEILGLNDVPNAGEGFVVIRDEKKFKQMLSQAKLQDRDQRLGSRSLTGMSGITTNADGEATEQKEFNVIIKADTQGSAEAVSGALANLSTDEIQVKILHVGTGEISEADVMLATASQALIIGFNVKEDANAQRIAEQNAIRIYKYDVIYHINEEMEKLMLGQLSPSTQEIEVGQAEVRQIFTVGKTMVIAGCMVTKGKVLRNSKAVVHRGKQELFTGNIDQLKRFKDDAKEVASGYECGISFNKFNDLETGDIITVYTVEETERTSL